MKNIIQSVKGTRDFYPDDLAKRSWLYDHLKQVSQAYGYQEYDGPFIEKIDLYAAKSGEELVKEQAFVFTDRGGDLITLRPELTLSLARMIAERQNELIYPLRWFSFGPFWRYERPQKGRTREFFQWNVDLVGVDSPEADAELISICASFFESVGLSPDQVIILVNDRRLMDTILGELNIPLSLKGKVFRLIDRRDRLSQTEWMEYGIEQGLSSEQIYNLVAVLDNKAIWRRSPHLEQLFRALDALGVSRWVQFDARIIRGLDYYTGTVFEALDRDGGRSILGGGRYDNLVADVGGQPLPGVGFAMGDVMAMIVLEKYGLIRPLDQFSKSVLVTVFDASSIQDSLEISQKMRNGGISTICYPEPTKLQKQLKFADRKGIRIAVIIGPDEISRKQVTIKNLAQSEQITVNQDILIQTLRKMLA